MNILVVEDEPKAGNYLLNGLQELGYSVSLARDGVDGLHQALETPFDVIVLDVMMPKMDGWEVLRRLRKEADTPVLFLTARDAAADKVSGLTLGGDDYVTKPFSLEELVARTAAVLRRTGGGAEGSVLRHADLELDEETHQVWRGETAVTLTATEFRLLRYLLLNSGRVLSKAQILDHVWRYDFGGNDNVVETYISYLRKKLDKLGPPLIQTVRGVGYSLRLAG